MLISSTHIKKKIRILQNWTNKKNVLTFHEGTNNNTKGNQWPTPGLGTERRRSLSVLIRWRATSFSSTTVECVFLLGVEDGTVPLGRKPRNKDGSTLLCLWGEPRWSFLPSRHEKMEAKRIKNRTSWEQRRAMEIVETATTEKEWEMFVCLLGVWEGMNRI